MTKNSFIDFFNSIFSIQSTILDNYFLFLSSSLFLSFLFSFFLKVDYWSIFAIFILTYGILSRGAESLRGRIKALNKKILSIFETQTKRLGTLAFFILFLNIYLNFNPFLKDNFLRALQEGKVFFQSILFSITFTLLSFGLGFYLLYLILRPIFEAIKNSPKMLLFFSFLILLSFVYVGIHFQDILDCIFSSSTFPLLFKVFFYVFGFSLFGLHLRYAIREIAGHLNLQISKK